jgi:hypothetical protein
MAGGEEAIGIWSLELFLGFGIWRLSPPVHEERGVADRF